DHRTAAKLRRAQRALARLAGALLLEGLLGRAGDVRDALGLVRTGAALGELPVDDARQNVGARRQAEDAVGELDGADFLGFEIMDLDLHRSRLPPDRLRRPVPPPGPCRAGPPGTADPSAASSSPRRGSAPSCRARREWRRGS